MGTRDAIAVRLYQSEQFIPLSHTKCNYIIEFY